MTTAVDTDLLAIADSVVERAGPGEQIEAFVSRGGETEIRVYHGEVEHFVSAQSEGVGVRVVRDGRTGFAYAGTLDDQAVGEFEEFCAVGLGGRRTAGEVGHDAVPPIVSDYTRSVG